MSDASPTRPPDTRGEPAPLSLGVFATGIVSLVLVIGGLFFLQFVYASQDRPLSPECQERVTIQLPGEDPKLLRGGSSVCHVVDALQSDAQTALLMLGLAAGVISMFAGFLLYKRMPNKRQREQCIAGAVLGIQAVMFSAVLILFRSGDITIFARNFLNFSVLEGSMDGFIRGAKNTVILAFAGELGGIIIGLVLALLAISDRRVVRAPARAYINFFRGTPLIWQLAFFYAVFLLGFQWRSGPFIAAIIVFSLNMGAYSAEVFRAGIQSVEKGQTEAARSLGMSYMQSMSYVIVPQAVRRVIPPLMNEFVILIKDTSLITVLGLVSSEFDIFTFSRQFFSESRNGTVFLGTAAAYLIVTLPLIRLVNYVEKRMRSGLVGVAG